MLVGVKSDTCPNIGECIINQASYPISRRALGISGLGVQAEPLSPNPTVNPIPLTRHQKCLPYLQNVEKSIGKGLVSPLLIGIDVHCSGHLRMHMAGAQARV